MSCFGLENLRLVEAATSANALESRMFHAQCLPCLAFLDFSLCFNVLCCCG